MSIETHEAVMLFLTYFLGIAIVFALGAGWADWLTDRQMKEQDEDE